MAKQFLTHINLSNNELQNALLHPLATAPASPAAAQIYFNTGSNKLFIFNGATWVDITGGIQSISSTTAAVTIDITDPSSPVIDIANADGTNAGLLTSAFFTDLTNATSASASGTLVKRDVNGDFSANDITANLVTGLATLTGGSSPSSAVNKQYVDNLVASGMRIVGALDCSTNPNYPAASVGDAYHVSVAGLIGGISGEVVSIGDLILCTTNSLGGDEATVGLEFIVMQENVSQATDTIIGLARIATSLEVSTGTNTNAYVTPSTLAAALSTLGSGTVNKFVGTIGNGINTQYVVNHALNEQYCNVQLYDAVSNIEVISDVELTDANNATIDFTVAPSTNAIRVVITG